MGLTIQNLSKNIKKKLFCITGIFYNAYNACWPVAMGVALVLAIMFSSKIYMTREILSTLLGGLITILSIFTAIVIAIIRKDIIVTLWKNRFINYVKYTVVIIIIDSIILILPTDLLTRNIIESFSFPLLLLNLFPVILMIKATEDYIDSILEKDDKYGYANLDLEARKWIVEKKSNQKENPLLDPKICQEMINDVSKKYDVNILYGGWMEDRRFLWKGSYLDKKMAYIHLGVDISYPAGTEIKTAFDSIVAKIDYDYPEVGGWGKRVIVKHKAEPLYFIYAHLDDRSVKCKVGDVLNKGEFLAKVGKAPFNGNWFEHLHVQAIIEEYYKEIEEKHLWEELDGYGSEEDIEFNAKKFPDSLKHIFK